MKLEIEVKPVGDSQPITWSPIEKAGNTPNFLDKSGNTPNFLDKSGNTPNFLDDSANTVNEQIKVYRSGQFENCEDSQGKKVNIYYSGRCPDSYKLFVSQVKPFMDKHGRGIEAHGMTMKYIPFGRTHIMPEGVMSCQHGPKECESNLYHVCAMNFIDKQELRLDWILCMLDLFEKEYEGRPGTPKEHATECSSKTNVGPSILKCAVEQQGKDLLKKAGEETREVIPNIDSPQAFIPTVTVDGGIAIAAHQDFPVAVCTPHNSF